MDVLITGSSKGIGFAAAEAVSRLGHRVFLTGRDGSALSASAERLNTIGFKGDMSRRGDIDAMMEFALSKGYYFGAVVHTVGGTLNGDSHPIDENLLNETMQMNLYSAVYLNSLLIPKMAADGGGRIVHISSMAAKDGNASPAYAMSKAALNAYIKNTARFYAKQSIMICGVMPGILDHEGSAWHNKSIETPEKYDLRKSQQPLGRFLKPEDIGGYIAFLTADKSMAYTGTIAEMCGGA